MCSSDLIERADAQGIARMDWHQTYLRALGKQDIRIKQIYRKYEKTGVISEEDSSYLESKGALMQTLKLVYSADKYLKMSVTFLNRRDTSTVLPQNETLFKTLIDAKHAAEDNNNFFISVIVLGVCNCLRFKNTTSFLVNKTFLVNFIFIIKK